MTAESVYLDYNATAPLLPEVITAVTAAFGRYGNPSSVHGVGRSARAAIEDARESVAAMVNTVARHVVFTSGGTEANALALRGLARARQGTTLLVSAVEHASVLTHAGSATRIPVNRDGIVDLSALEDMLKSQTAPMLVAVMLANNETGVLQPVAEAATLAHKYGALIHCDAVQAPGKVGVDVQALGVDSMSLSAHKCGGLKGVGALVLRPALDLAADMPGGGQERSRRAGTENVPGIVSFGAAAQQSNRLLEDAARVQQLRDYLEDAVLRIAPQAEIFARNSPRLANTSCLALPGISSETQLMKLDLSGVAVSAGSACSSGKIAASHVLLAMGVGEAVARSAIRVSLGWQSTARDIEKFLEVWRPLADAVAA
jgi:cysteine desulfurase